MYFTNITISKIFYGLSKLNFPRLFAKNSNFDCVGKNLDYPDFVEIDPKIESFSKIARYFDYFNRWWKLLLISKTLKFIKRSNFRKKYRHSICLIKLIYKTGRNVSEFLECDMNFEEVFFHYKHFWCTSSFRLY